jgi:hypothetical protein
VSRGRGSVRGGEGGGWGSLRASNSRLCTLFWGWYSSLHSNAVLKSFVIYLQEFDADSTEGMAETGEDESPGQDIDEEAAPTEPRTDALPEYTDETEFGEYSLCVLY